MMISPAGFVSQYEDKSLEEMIKARDELIKSIKTYEKKYIFHTMKLSKKEQEGFILPTPDTVYQCELLYLEEMCHLIYDKLNEDDKEEWEED